jgi:hypothetical protein
LETKTLLKTCVNASYITVILLNCQTKYGGEVFEKFKKFLEFTKTCQDLGNQRLEIVQECEDLLELFVKTSLEEEMKTVHKRTN